MHGSVDHVRDLVNSAGALTTRYGIVALLLLFGAMKWTPAEAQGIQPLIAHSPLWFWLYGVFGVQGTSIFFGVFEIAAALAIAVRPWFPVISAAGSAFCIVNIPYYAFVLTYDPRVAHKPVGGLYHEGCRLAGGLDLDAWGGPFGGRKAGIVYCEAVRQKSRLKWGS